MPEPRGKRRKRPRNRNRIRGDAPMAAPQAPLQPKQAPVRARRRFEMPLWLNLVSGGMLLGLGVLFSFSTARGFSQGERIIVLLGYFALAALYLSKAYRQYRQRQSQ